MAYMVMTYSHGLAHRQLNTAEVVPENKEWWLEQLLQLLLITARYDMSAVMGHGSPEYTENWVRELLEWPTINCNAQDMAHNCES